MTDLQIHELIRKDYEEGFAALFIKYYKSLVIFSCGMTGEPEASEDLVQTVFFKFVKDRRFNSVDPEKIKPYFFTAVRNATLNYLGGRKNSRTLDSLPELFSWPEEEELYDEPKIARIKEQIAALPPRTREIVEDILLRNMKYKEVAEKHSISVNTVKVLLGRGLKRLRTEMGEMGFISLILFLLKT